MKDYILKTVNKDMKSWGGFKWKKRGIVKCNDWKKTKECGNGLHGALNGVGRGGYLDGIKMLYGLLPKWIKIKE